MRTLVRDDDQLTEGRIKNTDGAGEVICEELPRGWGGAPLA